MSLTPMDIHNREFPVKMRGYDQDAVNDYFVQIIKEFERLIREKKDLEKEFSFSQEKLKYYDTIQDSLNRSILVAQEAADRLKENTAKEADVVVREAENNADALLRDAVDKALRIETETEDLRQQSLVFKHRLQLMIESQLEMLKKNEWDEILKAPEMEAVEAPILREVAKSLTHEEKDLDLEKESSDIESASKSNESSEREENPQGEGMTPAVELPDLP